MVINKMNERTLLIQREGKEKVRLDENKGLIFSDFVIDPPEPITLTGTVSNVDGAIDKGTTYGMRAMTARFLLFAGNESQFADFLHQLNILVDSKDYFHLFDELHPSLQWERVKLSGKITVEKQPGSIDAAVTIPLMSFYPYARFARDISVQAAQQGIPLDGVNYTRDTNSFSIWNIGDTTIDPRIHDLLIKFKGASSNLKIENLTTGDVWQYTGLSTAGDEITLDGVFSRKNGFSIFGETNHNLITIKNGKNDFRITGASDPFTIKFEFPTYYL
ncbi:MAG: phage-related protein [Bacillus sp. (in: firmicutes)]|jgi:hypothetical protein|nr:phage-related protein [Bacillus sp. (in: firmicutes)]